jgi:hypothetical protein
MSYTRDTFIFAGALCGFQFFGVLAAMKILDIRTDPVTAILAAGVAAGFAFFSVLAGRTIPGPPPPPPTLPP